MSGLDIFALIIMIVLLGAGVLVWIMLGMMPGKIARQRNHPQAEAISVAGWWGAITLGFLSPLAFIWAYTNPRAERVDQKSTPPREPDDDGKEDAS